MDCDGLRRVLFDHADGLLGHGDADAARDHLAACGPCRALQEEVRRNFTAMDAWDDEDLPAGAFERLQARFPVQASVAAAAGGAPHRSWIRLAVPYAAGLATAAAAAWAFLLPASTLPVPRRSGEAPLATPDTIRATGPGTVRATGAGTGVVPASAEGITADARSESQAVELRKGEQRLEFRDSSRGVRRNFRIPGDVDPSKVVYEVPGRIILDDEGVK